MKAGSSQQYLRGFPYALKTIHATLIHTASAKWIYGDRVCGRPVTLADSPFTKVKMATFAQIEDVCLHVEHRSLRWSWRPRS